MERILWLLSGCDGHLVKTLMEQFTASKSLKLPEDLHRKVSPRARASACKGSYCCQSFSTHFQNYKSHVGEFPS